MDFIIKLLDALLKMLDFLLKMMDPHILLKRVDLV